MMTFTLTKHAREEMDIRGIDEDSVRAVLESPGQIVAVRDGLVAYQSVLSLSGKDTLLRVIVSDTDHSMRVITVYKTSKVSKYWRSP